MRSDFVRLCGVLAATLLRPTRSGMTSNATVHADLSVMKIDNVLCNGQTEAESAELTRDRCISLLERPKEGGLPFGVDTNSGFGNLEHEMISLVVQSANFNTP